ncbi:hypothetical protein HPP92_017212 [Vanilla planifolia]|nr:hypothetical protein HPP92_017212 [Vanilla planifolia]
MGRRSSAGRSAPRAAPRPSPVRNPPQPGRRSPLPVSAPNGGVGSALGGLGGAIVDGIGFGTGSAIAHRAVDALLGPRAVRHEVVAPSEQACVASSTPHATGTKGYDACNLQSKAFQDCINSNGSEITKCQFYLDTLNECRHASAEVVHV